MLTEERYEKTLSKLEERKSVSVQELADEFSVSTETIRRDLVFLESKGKLKRVFGGAIKGGELRRFHDYSQRMIENRDKKTQLCKTAASLIEERDIIAIDSGSTANVLVDVLLEKFDKLTVITPSLDVFLKLKDKFTVIFSGGEYYEKEHTFYGELAVSAISRLHANKCFIFPSAVSLTHGIEDYVPMLIPIQKIMMEISDRIFILADSTKYGKRALVKLTAADPDFIYVTDNELDDDIYEKYSKKIYIVKGESSNE